MISLKAALIVASAVGTVGVGGATYASVTQPDAGLQSGSSRLPATSPVKKAVTDAVRPSCLPTTAPSILPKGTVLPDGTKLREAIKLPTGVEGVKLPDGTRLRQGAKLPEGLRIPAGTTLPDGSKVAKAPTNVKPPAGAEVPSASDLPKPGVSHPAGVAPGEPAPGKPELPKAELPKAEVPDAGVPGGAPAVPAAPPCADTGKAVTGAAPSAAPSTLPAPGGATAAPAAPKLSCDKLPPAVAVGGAVEKAITLPRGLHFSAAGAASRMVGAREVCVTTQKWTGRSGYWLTIERLKTAPQSTPDATAAELRKAAGIAADARKTMLGGAVAWQTPKGDGVLVIASDGNAFYINGSPALPGRLQDVASQLRLPA